MGLLNRIKRIVLGEANAAVNKAEDPTKISQQILREFNEELDKAINAEAQVKTIALRNKANLFKTKEGSVEWERKLGAILARYEKEPGNVEVANLVKIADKHYKESVAQVAKEEEISKLSDEQAAKMETTIKTLQNKISVAKDKANNIASRQKVAEATEMVNKSLSDSNANGLMSTLDGMEEKVSNTEFRAQAYAEGSGNTSDEALINAAIEDDPSVDDILARFKAKQSK